MKILNLAADGQEAVRKALRRPSSKLPDVSAILKDVRENGDDALWRLTLKFDGVQPKNIRVLQEDIDESSGQISPGLLNALLIAARNIETFHRETMTPPEERIVTIVPGVECRKKTLPIDTVGLYIPGGTAPLVSTVLMLGIAAKLAGVRRIVLCTPPNRAGNVPSSILAACRIVGIREVYAVGGAQAIAAMSYGTETIPKVDKIAGPGNAYVTAAKAAVSIDPEGAAIDMLAGPSEQLIVADASSDPSLIAADLLSQAEHDAYAQVVLITTSQTIINEVRAELRRQLADLPRRSIAEASLEQSVAVLVEDLDEAMELSNWYKPEHLLLQVEDPEALLQKVRNAGSVFLGQYSPETTGDYCSGPNHVLPTLGFAAASSGVSVATFQKTMTVQKLTREGLERIGSVAVTIARAEGLEGHARAVEIRTKDTRAEDVS